MSQHILSLSCPDRIGIIAAIARLMEERSCFISNSRTFGDPVEKRFFARLVIEAPEGADSEATITEAVADLAQDLAGEATFTIAGEKLRTLFMVSKSDHCASVLLHAARSGELPVEPVAIVSNHPDLGPALAHWGLPYYHVPVTPKNKPQAEARLFELIEETQTDLIVLARYMQVLSDDTALRLAGRCINIHHSFLPSFKGARPYHQAHERGVKIIGATAHYVTGDLDEGPIITQVAEPVDHTFSPKDMIEMGRHLEASALLRAVKAHAERRVFTQGRKTIVFAR